MLHESNSIRLSSVRFKFDSFDKVFEPKESRLVIEPSKVRFVDNQLGLVRNIFLNIYIYFLSTSSASSSSTKIRPNDQCIVT